MKALLLKNDGYAREQPESFVLEDMTPFVELGEIAEPVPTDGQVKIKITLASINPSDEMFIQGFYGQPRMLGNAAGFEAVGEVVESGGGKLADSIIGLRVAFVAIRGAPGTWGEFSIADAATCIPLIPGVSDENGAAMIVNPLSAYAMFGLVKEEDSKSFIVSSGASQLSKLMISIAKDEGYAPIAIVRRDSQIEMLKELGAAHVLNSQSDTFVKDLRALTRSEKPRVFLDAVSNQISANIFDTMPNRSRWVIYGKLDKELPTILQPGQMIFQSKRIEGFWLTRWMLDKPLAEKMSAIQAVQSRFASGEWKTDVTAIVSLDEAIERVPGELKKLNGKVFIKP